jgi:hypothetical protein
MPVKHAAVISHSCRPVVEEVSLPRVVRPPILQNEKYRQMQRERAEEKTRYVERSMAITKASQESKVFWQDDYIGSPKAKAEDYRKKHRAMKIRQAEKTQTTWLEELQVIVL